MASGSLAYRLAEHVLSAGLLATAALVALGAATDSGRAWVPGAALVAAAIAGSGIAVAVDRLRRGVSPAWRHVVNAALIGLLVALVREAPPDRALQAVGDLFAGERATQERVIRHQVYAAYRRMDLVEQRRVLERAEVFAPTVEKAAHAFALDEELLAGVAAAESSFYPRDSRDGGRGLFQITAVPPAAVQSARAALGVRELDPWNQLHNTYLAAATLALYAEQMRGDLFLTLLAYNIGPQNGGLRMIMQQYGARNFAQVQPYLQPLPREYPIRVLAGALAYRTWRRYHELPRFEDPEGARRVQSVGIPGLDAEGSSIATRPAVVAR